MDGVVPREAQGAKCSGNGTIHDVSSYPGLRNRGG